MQSPWIAALIALFLWWFATGAILLAVRHADRRGPRAGRAAVLLGLPVLGLGIWGYQATLEAAGAAAAYGGFLSALAIWGWIELAFLTGAVAGPNTSPCPPGLPLWQRFIRAWGTVAYHEMLLTAVLITMWLHGHDAANLFGVLTFSLLYGARVTAKLNLFLGVPRINLEFLPVALDHLASHFRIARFTWFFPLSVSLLTLALACWLERLVSAATGAGVVGYSLLAAMTALALLEHWLMVVPLPDAKLWRWMLPDPDTKKTKTRPEEHHGF